MQSERKQDFSGLNFTVYNLNKKLNRIQIELNEKEKLRAIIVNLLQEFKDKSARVENLFNEKEDFDNSNKHLLILDGKKIEEILKAENCYKELINEGKREKKEGIEVENEQLMKANRVQKEELEEMKKSLAENILAKAELETKLMYLISENESLEGMIAIKIKKINHLSYEKDLLHEENKIIKAGIDQIGELKVEVFSLRLQLKESKERSKTILDAFHHIHSIQLQSLNGNKFEDEEYLEHVNIDTKKEKPETKSPEEEVNQKQKICGEGKIEYLLTNRSQGSKKRKADEDHQNYPSRKSLVT